MQLMPIENTPALWLDIFPKLKPDGHKYDRGHALIYGGPMTGATRMSARAAQRMGAGLVSLAADAKQFPIYAVALESVIVREASDPIVWQSLLADHKHMAILIGPGLGSGPQEAEYVTAALKTRKPCVLDAGALTSFADNPKQLFNQLHPGCILTPHEGEFKRLFGQQIDPELDKVARTQLASIIAGCTVLLKGAQTVITRPGQAAILNDNAPPWLATAGAGDVLAGMILGLIVQQMPVYMAAAAATWFHGKIAQNFGPGLIAEDIIDGIPPVLAEIVTTV